jgi:hypothetical protein
VTTVREYARFGSLWVVILLASHLSSCQVTGGVQPAGPSRSLRAFDPARDDAITQSGVTEKDGAWQIQAGGPMTVRLFEVPDPDVEQTMLTYRVELKAQEVKGRAYLEMWVRLPGMGEFFSRGLEQTVSGASNWATYETPFFLQKGQKPDLVKLNIVFDGGGGTLWMRNAELLATPLKG